MNALLELGCAVRERRQDMGMTQATLARLSGLSRATVNQLENATAKELGIARAQRVMAVVGLSVVVTGARNSARSATPALLKAARAASVSYREVMGAETLAAALGGDAVPVAFMPHVRSLLEEASVALLAEVVEDLHARRGTPHADVWRRMRQLAQEFMVSREIWS
jgi:transcriptional regulator with XRE-family HTH domain